MGKIEPITLSGRYVRLELLKIEHATDLYEVGKDPVLWRYMSGKGPHSVGDMEEYIAEALRDYKAGTALPFAIIALADGRVVGSTRIGNIDQANRGVEIGWTWVTPAVQRSGINTECKYLLLRHAFEALGAIRVQLKTHHQNLQSQRAIERLGATREGILRNHRVMADGLYLHSVIYSVIESEWPVVKAHLEALQTMYA
ncbi:N-acetyltransferase [Ktedonosporobacter rubrisoli]|uniref:N-acetyltransferase n=1 Tax=Ktedonosporobacter rubrisoli TaxID=2509675 RepID=A0A4P6JKT6_KTERU|nr:GNAT family protein [Ktedonosporobacter rubrisoli]QBD75817.1 N-acetyltransferase [Ktedonosporobacter rubrisoli]